MVNTDSKSTADPDNSSANKSKRLASGTYEVLQSRLREAAADLRGRFLRLNQSRASVFGNIETKLGSTAHVTTDHNCVPRDLLAINDMMLLGYNVQFGLKTEINTNDVFGLYRIEDSVAHQLDLSTLFGERFERDFAEVYRYYKHATFSRFFVAGPLVYFVFQVGKSATDIKALKWALDGQQLKYVDNRGDQEVRYPEQHAFRWQRATRDQHRSGLHPHISIDDTVFVECVGGDLTIKVEDNTEDGSGIYAEPVENPDQTLDDAEIYSCVLGNLVLLRMRPYQEKDFRHLVFSVKRQTVTRIDAIERSCVLLPDDHGIIYPGGFFLQTGVSKSFDHGLEHLLYERTVVAPNGEDYLYIFTDPDSGTYLQLRYNLIRQEVDTPLVCHGQAFYDDGRMITFRSQEGPQKHHALQLWQTPFVGPNYQTHVETDSMLYKIGNRELVRGMAECQELLQLIDKDDSYADLYLDLVKRSTGIVDSYFWLDREETMRLIEPLEKIRDTATAAVEEFEKVVRVRRETEKAVVESQQHTKELVAAVGRAAFHSVDDFIAKLSSIRELRGHALGLRERHYVDEADVAAIESTLVELADRLGHRCVQFLLSPESLAPYRSRVLDAQESIADIDSAKDGRELQERLATIGGDLELLIETVSQLKIEDLTQRTAIVDQVGDVLAELNRVRSALKAKVRELLSGEMEADFASQTKLLDQAAAGALETADTPQRVDEAMTRMMLQLEELEGRFAEFDELLMRLTEKRETLYEAFEARRQQLVEARSRRAESMAAAADRILEGIQSRAQRLPDADALRSYFVSDPMVDKVRGIAAQLGEIGDSVRMDDVLSRLKTVSDDALRQLRDRQDLFSDGDALIQLGSHRFTVNRQPVELTTVAKEGELFLHLTGTQYYQRLQHESLESSRDLWQQLLPSESEDLYRSEFLAAELFDSWDAKHRKAFTSASEPQRIEMVRTSMQSRHSEGYSRGVHDHDAAAILSKLIEINSGLGLLRFAPDVRGVARYAWQCLVPENSRNSTERWISGFAAIKGMLPKAVASQNYRRRIVRLLRRYASTIVPGVHLEECTDYLFHQLAENPSAFVASREAIETLKHLDEHLPSAQREKLRASVNREEQGAIRAWTLALDAIEAYTAEASPSEGDAVKSHVDIRPEIAALLLLQDQPTEAGPATTISHQLTGMAGDHSRIASGQLDFHYHEFLRRTGRYRKDTLRRFHELRECKHRLVAEADRRLRTEEFRPKVLTSFVRNKLIDEVYLPLTGDNLAKQIGASGDGMRTDRMGLLLLISPPGYGKTTLMEYVANRLGLVFVKVNGPALGHNVTSLDPKEASNASARQEVERINTALEMGDNVMLYLDDIQHCNPELLQKFIPLCDATRRIEGVWEGEPKTYDLRGRKFAVVMAGNPYTESGERFQIPDMLSNRADVYNLGEIIGDARDAFELSYLENCLTSNVALQALARASSKDQRTVIRAAQRGSLEGLDLEANIGADDLSDMVSVLSKLLRVRDIILRVNRTYIRSAAQADAYRTEPPFKLQGSYRNMNRIAERVVPVMNDEELESLVFANYEQDAQTLTRDGESNLLKFKELVGSLTDEETERWNNIKYAFVESVRMQGIDGEDTAAQVLRSLSGLRDGLESIRRTISKAVALDGDQKRTEALLGSVEGLSSSLAQLGANLTETIASAGAELARERRNLPDQKVLVQHSVPRVMTDLVESQFQLLYDGLKPVLESSAMSKTQLEHLRTSIDKCLDNYREMQTEIDSAKE